MSGRCRELVAWEATISGHRAAGLAPRGEGIDRRGRVLALLTSLKQICNHLARYLGERRLLTGRSGKLDRVIGMLAGVVAAGDRALVHSVPAHGRAARRPPRRRARPRRGAVPARRRRDELGLEGGTTLEIRVRAGRLELEPASTPMRLVRRGKGLVATSEEPLPPIDADDVRAITESLRR